MKTFLPIGSVVLLKGADKKVMICGRMQMQPEDEKIYDYSGCMYPEGILDTKHMYLFCNEDIDRLYYVGMQDEDEFKLRAQLEQLTDEQR